MVIQFRQWKKDILEHKGKILLALLFLSLAIISTIISGQYVDETRSISVPDLLLDSLPTINLSFLFVWGAIIVLAVYLAYPLIFEPRKFHYSLGMLSLFFLVRSAFIVLTHLKAPAGAVAVAMPNFLQLLAYSNDLFFSGHAGLPFLGFLVYNDKKIKYFMLASSIILAITVLLMHIHYSIDVASAYFITYGIYIMGTPLFADIEMRDKIANK